jgi:hypothetical protein
MGSVASAGSVYEKIGGSKNVSSIASDLVNSSLKDPRLSGLTAGRTIDSSAASTKISGQLCAMLGGGCKAPMTDSQMASASAKISTDQSQAISDNFTSSLNKVVSDPATRSLVSKTMGSKLSGLLGGAL